MRGVSTKAMPHIGRERKKSAYGYSDRRFNPRLHQYVRPWSTMEFRGSSSGACGNIDNYSINMLRPWARHIIRIASID